MITKVCSSYYGLKNNSQNKSNVKNNASAPIQNISVKSAYSLNNVKANYMPAISFGNDPVSGTNEPLVQIPAPAKAMPDPKEIRKKLLTQVPYDSSFVISSLTEKDRIEGPYYKPLSDDLAILMTSDKDGILVVEKGVNPEIFVHMFTNNVMGNKYEKLGFSSHGTDVIFIQDPLVFGTSNCMEKTINETEDSKLLEAFKGGSSGTFFIDTSDVKDDGNYFLQGLEKMDKADDKSKVVFVKDFDKVMASMGDYYNGRSFRDNLMREYPNLNIIGFVSKNELALSERGVPSTESDAVRKRNLLKHMQEMPQLPLGGLSVPETEDFFRRNPIYYFGILDKYQPYFTDVSEKAMRRIISTAAKDDSALPTAALLLLDRVTSSKLQDTKIRGSKALWRVTTADVDKYLKKHKALVNISKNPDVKIEVIEDITTKMEDLAGLDAAKSKFEDIFEYIKDPDKFIESGRKAPGGVLLTGEPGTGKTEFARAVVGEVKKRTGKDVPFFRMHDFGSIYVNSSAMAMNNSYNEAREYCRKIGAKVGIMFIDEADRIGRKISNGGSVGQQEDDKATNALKEHLDGMESKTSDIKIITIAATNHPEVLDESLLRPSRFKVIKCEIPEDKETIKQLLQIHSKNKPFENEFEKSLLIDELSDCVRGLNGDQMTEVLDESTRLALKTDKKVITRKEIIDGFINALFGEKSKTDFSPKERLIASAHEALHAEAATFSKSKTLIAISNESRGNAAASTFAVNKNIMFKSFEDAIDDVVMNDAGGYGETLINKNHGSGVSGDYRKKTSNIDAAIKKGGLGIYTPQISFFDEEGHENIELSKQYATEIKKDYTLFSETSSRIIKQIIKAHKDWLINGYLEENRAAIEAGKDGKNYMGQEYIDLRTKWFVDHGTIKSEPVLENGLDAFKQIAHTDKFWTENAGLNNARNIMSDGVETIIGLSQERSWLDDSTKTAEGLNKHIGKIVELAEGGSKWLEKALLEKGKDSLEEKLIKTVREITDAAKGIEPKEAKSLISRAIGKVIKTVK